MPDPRDALEKKPTNVVHDDVMINPSPSGSWGKLPIIFAAILLLVIVGAFVMASSRASTLPLAAPGLRHRW